MLKDDSEVDQINQIPDSPPLRPLRKRQRQNKEYQQLEETLPTVAYVIETELEVIDEPLDHANRFSFSQLQYIVQELLTSEISYIQMITKGITNYLSIYNGDNAEKYHIFANIADIKNFHANVFYPSLVECGNDLELICNRFYDFIQVKSYYIVCVKKLMT